MSTSDSEREGAAVPRLSARQWTLVGLGLAALTAAVAWFALVVTDEPVRYRDVGFSVESPTEATATFDVFLYTDAEVTCRVRALNDRFTEVGTGTVDVDPAAGDEQRIELPLTTTERATTAVVQYCTPS